MKISLFQTIRFLLIGCVLFLGSISTHAGEYDPMAVSANIKVKIIDITVHDKARVREIPIRVYLPSVDSPLPVILFSHGLGGSRETCAYIGEHWSARGYTVVFLQHPGSDNSVGKGLRLRKRMKALKNAGNAHNLQLRVQDVDVVLDTLDKWNTTDGHKFKGLLELKKVGMSGHSFGARTTQAVSGQRFKGEKATFTDSRIIAALLMSPSSPSDGTPKEVFSKVSVPWMLMTGTRDSAPFGAADVKSRLAVFPALPPGGKYELVLFEAEHSAFTASAMRRRAKARNPNHHQAILAISTAFWDAYLRKDTVARKWLDGDGPRTVLEKRDAWQIK